MARRSAGSIVWLAPTSNRKYSAASPARPRASATRLAAAGQTTMRKTALLAVRVSVPQIGAVVLVGEHVALRLAAAHGAILADRAGPSYRAEPDSVHRWCTGDSGPIAAQMAFELLRRYSDD